MKKKIIIPILIIIILSGMGFVIYSYFKNNKTVTETTVDDGSYICSKRVINEDINGSNEVIHEYDMDVTKGSISNLKYYEILFYADTKSYQDAIKSNNFGDMTVLASNEERLFVELFNNLDTDLTYNDFIKQEDLANYDCTLSQTNKEIFNNDISNSDIKYRCLNGKEIVVLTVDANDYVTSMYQGSIKTYSDPTTYYNDKKTDQDTVNEYLKFEYDDKNYTITQMAITRLDSNPTYKSLINGQLENYTCSKEYNQ